MLCYAPSLIAASAAFLAKYILSPSKKPWVCHVLEYLTDFSISILSNKLWNIIFYFLVQNSTLRHYTLYQAADLFDCVKALHRLCCNGCSSDLPAVREKYCQHKV